MISSNTRTLSDSVAALGRATEELTELTRNAKKDTQAVKALTTVAALYLPATLVASIFNSNLVQKVSSNGGSSGTKDSKVVLASNFWMFPVFTIILMVLTLGPACAWVRYLVSKI